MPPAVEPREMMEPGERAEAARRVIRDTMWWSMGAGLVPPPFADVVALSSVHLGMLKSLAAIHGIRISEERARAVIASLTGSLVAHVVARDVSSGAIALSQGSEPFLGSMSLWQYAGASGFAVGRVLARHFESGGELADFVPARHGAFLREQFDEGARLAQEMADRARAASAPDAPAGDAVASMDGSGV